MKPTLYKVDFCFVHHTAVSYILNPDQWKATNSDHKARFGMKSSLGYFVGYNYEISANGTIRQARQEGEETAAVIAFNKRSVSICLDGNFDIELPTIAQTDALGQLLIEIMIRHNIPLGNVQPHRFACGNPPGSPLSPTNPPYKSCYGHMLPDNWPQDLVAHYQKVKPPLGSPDASKHGC